jgi:hypothetical protein
LTINLKSFHDLRYPKGLFFLILSSYSTHVSLIRIFFFLIIFPVDLGFGDKLSVSEIKLLDLMGLGVTTIVHVFTLNKELALLL